MAKFDYAVERATEALREWFLYNRCAYCASKPFLSATCMDQNCAVRHLYCVADDIAAAVLRAAKVGKYRA